MCYNQGTMKNTQNTLETGFLDAIGFPPDDFQEEAMLAIASGEHVVVSAPTGSGKTLIAEYAAYRAVTYGERLFYTTPLKALSNQKYRDFCKQYGDARVGLMTGDTTTHRDASIVVMTTEVFRNMLYGVQVERDALIGVRYVVLDECHYMNDADRGTVWEESIIHSPNDIQILALSATVANANELAGWIASLHGPTKLITSDFRPVPLRFSFYSTEQDKVLPLFKPSTTELNPNLKHMSHGAKKQMNKPFHPNKLIRQLAEKEMLPAIIFTFSRKGCDKGLFDTLGQWGKLDLLTAQERENIQKQVASFVAANPIIAGNKYLPYIENGCASHHAGLLPVLKELVEKLFQQGLIKAVFATETLAAGINMPARTTVITSISKRVDHGHRLLTASEFLQMSGRAGRRGMDTVGYVVNVSSPYESAAEMALLARSKPEALNSRFTPTYSMVLNLLKRYTLDEAEQVIAKSFGTYTIDRRLEPIQYEKKRYESSLDEAEEFVCPAELSREDFQKYRKQKDHLKNAYKILETYRKQVRQAPGNPAYKRALEEEQVKVAELKSTVDAFACEHCHILKKHHAVENDAEKAIQKIGRLHKIITYEHQAYWQQFLNHYHLLKAEGYLTADDKPTEYGELMSQLRTENELFLTEVIIQKQLDGLTSAQLTAAIVAMIFDDNRDHPLPKMHASPPVELALKEIKQTVRQLDKRQRQFYIEKPMRINPLASGLSEAWVDGITWEKLVQASTQDEGDLVRLFRRTADVLRQIAYIKGMPQDLANTARDALYSMYRPPITDSDVFSNELEIVVETTVDTVDESS